MIDASLPIPFAIGQELWWVGHGSRTEWVPCPECAGTKIITMIQGNGEEVSLDCPACSLGCEPPRGAIQRTVYENTPTRFVPGRVRVDGDEIMYSESGPDATCYSSAYAKDLFISKDECQARCDALNEERTKADEQRAIANLASKRRNMAWSVHYWGQKVKELERDLERVRARLNVSKERAKKPKPEAGGEKA